MTYINFEISIFRRDDSYYDDRYNVDIRWQQEQADHWEQGAISLNHLDINRLCPLEPLACGQALSKGVFSDSRVLDHFKKAREAATAAGQSLRVRLLIGSSTPELHNLPWETLCDPCQDDSAAPLPLFLGERFLFSRYLTSADWRPVRMHPQRRLRALVVIANPKDLSEYQLAAIDVAAQRERAKKNLGDIATDYLASAGEATLDNLKARLYQGCDILYLVCHGAFIKGEPYLWLEDKDGNTAHVAGDELATQVNELLRLPRMVVLLSCQSAGGDGADALTALGPRLAKNGISAVLAIQGKIAISTADLFLSAFFIKLWQNGELEEAMAVARDKVRNEHDWWMPVLFTRLHEGRIWYAIGFTEKRDESWQALIENIKVGTCTPIIGPDLFEDLLGSRREIAQRWADNFNFPLAPYHRVDLPQVAQYLATLHGRDFPRVQLAAYLKQDLLRRYKSDIELASPKGIDPSRLSLDHLTQVVGDRLRERDSADPFRALAGLPIPIYITTNPTNLLQHALIQAGKRPHTLICPWNNNIRSERYDRHYIPSVGQPLVYHLFGKLEDPKSWVLTEDDFLQFLIGFANNRSKIPPSVLRGLAATSLLFLGFQMEDWNFRTVLNTFLSLEGHMKGYSSFQSLGVQIAPEEGWIRDPGGARRYLERYFTTARIAVFWGQARDFLHELSKKEIIVEGGGHEHYYESF
jgi:hypothetical protein